MRQSDWILAVKMDTFVSVHSNSINFMRNTGDLFCMERSFDIYLKWKIAGFKEGLRRGRLPFYFKTTPRALNSQFDRQTQPGSMWSLTGNRWRFEVGPGTD